MRNLGFCAPSLESDGESMSLTIENKDFVYKSKEKNKLYLTVKHIFYHLNCGQERFASTAYLIKEKRVNLSILEEMS